MENYIIAITRDALKNGDITIDDFVERIKGIEDLKVPDSFDKKVQVEYAGSREELYETLGYTSRQVHIEPVIMHQKRKE